MRRKKKAESFPWLTRVQAGELIELSARQFDDAIRPRLDSESKRGSGAKLRYHASAIVRAFVTYRVEQQSPVGTGEDDELLDPRVSSPNLERLRGFKADIAQLDWKEKDKQLVSRDVIFKAMRPAATGLRGAGDRLILRYGNDAGEIYNEAVQEFLEAMEKAVRATDAKATSMDRP